MNVTCLCMYHGRNECLREAVESYRRLEPVDGVNTELFVFSDIEEQEPQIVGVPSVRVFNHHEFSQQAEKQNCGVQLSGEWVLLWDDDDISLPWRLRVMVEAQRKTGALALCTTRAWYVEDTDILNISANLFAGSAFFNRDYYLDCGGCPLGFPPDRGAWYQMHAAGRTAEVEHSALDIPYIYRWQKDVPHDSGMMFRNAALKHAQFHGQVVNHSQFKRGVVQIEPYWKRDYVADVRLAIEEGRDVI